MKLKEHRSDKVECFQSVNKKNLRTCLKSRFETGYRWSTFDVFKGLQLSDAINSAEG